jgi:hypothetical protein
VVTAGQDPGRILIDDEPVRIALVRLSLPRRCARRPFAAVLTGSGVERVDFRVDRRRLRSVRRAGRDGRFALRIDPVRFKRGRHTVTAHVFFSTSATRAGKLVIGTFRSCRRR